MNGIAPGIIEETEGYERLNPKDFDPKDTVKYIPAERLGKKEDISKVALFLVSPAASYINGVTFLVDGGMNLTLRNRSIMSKNFRDEWKAKL